MNEYMENGQNRENNAPENEAAEKTESLASQNANNEEIKNETVDLSKGPEIEKAENEGEEPDFEIELIDEEPCQVQNSSFTVNPPPVYNAGYTPRENRGAPSAYERGSYQYSPAPGAAAQPPRGPQYTRPPVDPKAKGNESAAPVYYSRPVPPARAAQPVPPSNPPAPPMGAGAVPPPPRPVAPQAGMPHESRPQAPRSNEYRYAPPYGGPAGPQIQRNEGATPPPPRPVSPQPPKKEKKEKVKTVRTFPTIALVLILVGSIFLSFAGGMAGGLLVCGGFKMNEPDKIVDKGNGEDKGKLDIEIPAVEPDENEGDKESSDGNGAQFEGSYDLTDVCAVVSSSVVEISTEFNQTYYGYYQYVQEGAGSGVIVSEDGYVITNAHVITDAQSGKLADAIKVRLISGDEYVAKIVGSDNDSDIALLKIEAKDLVSAKIGNSDSIKVGEQVIAVGNPLGELGGTVTSGIVSATNREISVENNKMTLIQIDAAINPGNSGGGLFNTKGELIGIVNAKTTDVTVEGLGFAIPVNEAVKVVKELESNGYVTGKTHIGISLTDVTDSFSALYYFNGEATGVYVVNVQKGYNEGVLQYGDRISAINGVEITSSEDVKEIVSESEVGDVLIFTIYREKKLLEVEVTCYEYVPEKGVSFN